MTRENIPQLVAGVLFVVFVIGCLVVGILSAVYVVEGTRASRVVESCETHSGHVVCN